MRHARKEPWCRGFLYPRTARTVTLAPNSAPPHGLNCVCSGMTLLHWIRIGYGRRRIPCQSRRDFWSMEGAARQMNKIHALKNLAIMAGLLLLIAKGAGRYSVDERSSD